MSAFVHLELGTDDVDAASRFYQKVFGWKLSPMTMPDGSSYVTFTPPDGGPGGGIGGKMDPSQPTAWLPYIGVRSLKKTVEQARSLGATILVEHMPVMDMGALAILVDPTGAKLGLWEPAMTAPAPKKKAAKKASAKKAAKKKAPPPKKAAKKKAAPPKKAAKKKRR